MNINQWTEISSIIGHFDGMATVLEMTEEIDPKKFREGLIKLKDRLVVLHTDLREEVLNNEKEKALKPKQKIITKSVLGIKTTKKTEDKK